MKLIKGIVPPNGFHLPVGDVILRSDSVEGLVSVVEAFRAENGLPYKEVEPEIYEYFCTRWPHFCHFYDKEAPLQQQQYLPVDTQQQLLNDLQSWSASIINQQNAPLMVDSGTAEARADICNRCDHNVKWKSGCGSCINAIERTAAAIRSAQDTTTSKRLGACRVMRHCNRTAVWLDRVNFLKPAETLPKACWLNQ